MIVHIIANIGDERDHLGLIRNRLDAELQRIKAVNPADWLDEYEARLGLLVADVVVALGGRMGEEYAEEPVCNFSDVEVGVAKAFGVVGTPRYGFIGVQPGDRKIGIVSTQLDVDAPSINVVWNSRFGDAKL